MTMLSFSSSPVIRLAWFHSSSGGLYRPRSVQITKTWHGGQATCSATDRLKMIDTVGTDRHVSFSFPPFFLSLFSKFIKIIENSKKIS
jgi:hypothetical protein